MARFDTLNAATQDMVVALLPALAKAFGVEEVKDIIPEDIRMRIWDCDRRDHIKDRSEDDPRNWGVQFLRELQAIARLSGNDLVKFQTDLRAKVEKHDPRHPWARLADIKEIKTKYENPNMDSEDQPDPDEYISEEPSSPDSYFEELVEHEPPKGTKCRHRGHEVYETRLQPQPKSRKRKFWHF